MFYLSTSIVLNRVMASKVGLDKLAAKIQEHELHALLIIGGYEVNSNEKENKFCFTKLFVSFRLICPLFKCTKLELNIQHFKFH